VLKGFRAFIMRGNVVELAVGVVIGAAFNGLVTQLTKSFLEPLIKLISGGRELSGTFKVADVVFDWAAFVNAVFAFILTAAALYFVIVLPMNKLNERLRRGDRREEEVVSEEVRLLTEIRDALVADRHRAGGPPSPDGPTYPAQGGTTYGAPRQQY